MDEVSDVGRSTLLPGGDVMRPAHVERRDAIRVGTGAIHRSQALPLWPRGGATGQPDIERSAIAIENEGSISASQHKRRTVEIGSGIPSSVSQMPARCAPTWSERSSIRAMISGTRVVRLPPPIAPTSASTVS